MIYKEIAELNKLLETLKSTNDRTASELTTLRNDCLDKLMQRHITKVKQCYCKITS